MNDSPERVPEPKVITPGETAAGGVSRVESHGEGLGLLDLASDLIHGLDTQRRLHFVNRTWRDTLGYSAAEATRLAFDDIIIPASRPVMHKVLAKLADGDETMSFETLFRAKDGHEIPVAGTLIQRTWPERLTARGNTTICICHEMTSRRVAEEQRREIVVREKQLNELKAHFVSTASHEMRTPLATLSLGVDFLVKYWTKLDEKQITQSLQSIHAGVQQLRTVLDDVLVVGRSDEGQLACKVANLELVSFCNALVDEVMAVDLGQHAVEWRCDREFLEAKVDARLLRQILFNLLSNACKFSPENSSVELAFEPRGESLVFTVTDSGIGIPTEDQARLFDLFFRGSNSGQRPGSGLGLSVVRRCIEAHGGNIAFETAPGRGTRFIVTLPA